MSYLKVVKKKACFFSHENIEQLQKEQYSIQDIQILKDLGFDVVIATNFNEIPMGCDLYFSWWASGSILPLIKARLSGKPIIVVAGGNETMFYCDSLTCAPSGYLATPFYKKIATRMSLRFSTYILVVSEFMVNDVKRIGGVDPIVVHNSINIEQFRMSSSKRKYISSIFNLEDNVVRIKRGESFIRSIPYVLEFFPDLQCIIIGDKRNAYDRLLILAIELKIEKNLKFIGSIPNIEVVDWLQQSKVYVQVSDTETFGVTIGEAMSCGTPVVASNRGAIPELLGSCGTYVNQNDPKSIANGIIDVLNKSEDEYKLLSIKSRERIIDNFSFEKRKIKIKQIINEIIEISIKSNVAIKSQI